MTERERAQDAALLIAARATIRRLQGLLESALLELDRGRIFISSREKMHPVGIELWDELKTKIRDALKDAP